MTYNYKSHRALKLFGGGRLTLHVFKAAKFRKTKAKEFLQLKALKFYAVFNYRSPVAFEFCISQNKFSKKQKKICKTQ
jgi:hypothetical protein